MVTVLADVVFNSTSTSNLYSNRGFTVLYIAVLLSNPPYTSHYGTVQYSTYCSLCVFVLRLRIQYWRRVYSYAGAVIRARISLTVLTPHARAAAACRPVRSERQKPSILNATVQ